jgi:hypothetical protein
MNRNVLYLLIAALVVTTVVFGHQLYQERQKATGIGINVGERGISIETKQFDILELRRGPMFSLGLP